MCQCLRRVSRRQTKRKHNRQPSSQEDKVTRIHANLGVNRLPVLVAVTDSYIFSSVLMQSRSLKDLLDKWPGKKYLGIYRFLPIFFALGAALEFSMIHWKVGSTNFCKI